MTASWFRPGTIVASGAGTTPSGIHPPICPLSPLGRWPVEAGYNVYGVVDASGALEATATPAAVFVVLIAVV